MDDIIDMQDRRCDLMDAISSLQETIEALKPWAHDSCDALDDIRLDLEAEREELERKINELDPEGRAWGW